MYQIDRYYIPEQASGESAYCPGAELHWWHSCKAGNMVLHVYGTDSEHVAEVATNYLYGPINELLARLQSRYRPRLHCDRPATAVAAALAITDELHSTPPMIDPYCPKIITPLSLEENIYYQKLMAGLGSAGFDVYPVAYDGHHVSPNDQMPWERLRSAINKLVF